MIMPVIMVPHVIRLGQMTCRLLELSLAGAQGCTPGAYGQPTRSPRFEILPNGFLAAS